MTTKRFNVYYNYNIKDEETDELVFWKKDVLEIDAVSRRDVDTARIRTIINEIAEKKVDGDNQYVNHCNYYKIEEV